MKNKYRIISDAAIIEIWSKKLLYECKIDTEDLDKVKELGTSWGIARSNSSYFMVRTIKQVNGERKAIGIHNIIMNPPDGMVVDHINGDTLDNRKRNLRTIPRWGNAQNVTKLLRNNRSGVRGVSWYKSLNKWRAKATLNNKDYHLGYYDSLEEAEKTAREFRRKRMLYSSENIRREHL